MLPTRVGDVQKIFPSARLFLTVSDIRSVGKNPNTRKGTLNAHKLSNGRVISMMAGALCPGIVFTVTAALLGCSPDLNAVVQSTMASYNIRRKWIDD